MRSPEAPRVLSHDVVYVGGCSSAADALRKAAVVVSAVLDADDRVDVDNVMVRLDELDWEALINFAVPGPEGVRFLTDERLDEIAAAALARLEETT